MPVSGLVVSFSDQLDLREQAIAAISRESRMEPGVLESNRMAVVVDTMTAEEDKQLWNWLTSLSGVAFVDVVMVGFEDRVESPNEYFSEHSQGTVDHGS